MNIVGITGLTPSQIQDEINQGGRFVLYRYCISLLVITLRRSSDIYFVRAGESRVTRGLPLTFLTFVMGWWGIPWGPIYSIQCLYVNLRGGEDVTAQVQNSFRRTAPSAGSMPPPIPGSTHGG